MYNIKTIKGLNGGVIEVTPEYLRFPAGPAGTLYKGDANLLMDYIAKPAGNLHIQGVLHHINMSHRDGVFSLSINFCGDIGEFDFDQLTARELIFALATVPKPEYNNPHR